MVLIPNRNSPLGCVFLSSSEDHAVYSGGKFQQQRVAGADDQDGHHRGAEIVHQDPVGAYRKDEGENLVERFQNQVMHGIDRETALEELGDRYLRRQIGEAEHAVDHQQPGGYVADGQPVPDIADPRRRYQRRRSRPVEPGLNHLLPQVQAAPGTQAVEDSRPDLDLAEVPQVDLPGVEGIHPNQSQDHGDAHIPVLHQAVDHRGQGHQQDQIVHEPEGQIVFIGDHRPKHRHGGNLEGRSIDKGQLCQEPEGQHGQDVPDDVGDQKGMDTALPLSRQHIHGEIPIEQEGGQGEEHRHRRLGQNSGQEEFHVICRRGLRAVVEGVGVEEDHQHRAEGGHGGYLIAETLFVGHRGLLGVISYIIPETASHINTSVGADALTLPPGAAG